MRTPTFILLFAALLFLPLVQMLTGVIPVAPVSENRSLAPAPGLATPLARIPHVANEWFNDHFGLRPLLIRLKTQIDYSVFKTSDRVLVGSDGWLFYRGALKINLAKFFTLAVGWIGAVDVFSSCYISSVAAFE